MLRLVATDAPSLLSLHYSGAAEGPGQPFAIELRHFERESERCQLLQPHLGGFEKGRHPDGGPRPICPPGLFQGSGRSDAPQSAA